jgi:hypothetical protein
MLKSGAGGRKNARFFKNPQSALCRTKEATTPKSGCVSTRICGSFWPHLPHASTLRRTHQGAAPALIDCLEPPETRLDALALPLADCVTSVPRAALINCAAATSLVFCAGPESPTWARPADLTLANGIGSEQYPLRRPLGPEVHRRATISELTTAPRPQLRRESLLSDRHKP